MSFLKKPFRKLKGMNETNYPVKNTNTDSDSTPSKTEGVNGSSNTTPENCKASGTSTPRLNGDSKMQSRQIIAAERASTSMDKGGVKAENEKKESRARIEERFLQEGPPDLTKLYRPCSMNMSKRWNHEHRVLFKELDFESKSERCARLRIC